MHDRRDLVMAACMLLRRLNELTDEMMRRSRPAAEIQSEQSRLKLKWEAIMDELRNRSQPASYAH